MLLSAFAFVSFPLLDRLAAGMIRCSVFHGESILRAWLKHNPLSFQGPEPSKELTCPRDMSSSLHLSPAKKPSSAFPVTVC